MTTNIASFDDPACKRGRFHGGEHKPLMAMVEITNRCNMSCPICFTDASKHARDVDLDEIKTRLDNLLEVAGPVPVQISGGEPTLHPELPAVIRYAKHRGFNNIELVTNGIIIGKDPHFLCRLVDMGLSAVYLQFDGLTKETYQIIRGQDMGEVRMQSIAAIRRAGVCCTLAVAVARGVNDHELGDIVNFGIRYIDTVRAINFQSATKFSGRYNVIDSSERSYTLSELTRSIEEQSGLAPGGFVTDLIGHSHCNAMSLVYVVDDRLESLFSYISQETREEFLGSDKRTILLDLFKGKEYFCRKYLLKPKTWRFLIEAVEIFGRRNGFTSVINARHILLFAKSFMDQSTVDIGRLNKCCYGIAGTDGVYSFCAYNNLHRFHHHNRGPA
jgi:uncharacterized radical SAM superfamily Fe-S cluster-containing enzyme